MKCHYIVIILGQDPERSISLPLHGGEVDLKIGEKVEV